MITCSNKEILDDLKGQYLKPLEGSSIHKSSRVEQLLSRACSGFSSCLSRAGSSAAQYIADLQAATRLGPCKDREGHVLLLSYCYIFSIDPIIVIGSVTCLITTVPAGVIGGIISFG
jgi:hypothetical protein